MGVSRWARRCAGNLRSKYPALTRRTWSAQTVSVGRDENLGT